MCPAHSDIIMNESIYMACRQALSQGMSAYSYPLRMPERLLLNARKCRWAKEGFLLIFFRASHFLSLSVAETKIIYRLSQQTIHIISGYLCKFEYCFRKTMINVRSGTCMILSFPFVLEYSKVCLSLPQELVWTQLKIGSPDLFVWTN